MKTIIYCLDLLYILGVLDMVVLVDGFVGFSPMPCDDRLLERLASEFDSVVVLVDDWELCYDLSFWEKKGVDILRHPIEDFRAPCIVCLHKIIEWILEKVSKNKRVLVHCMGGYGRSGVIAAAYLVAKYGYTWKKAVQRVRELRPGSIESSEQLSVLRAYSLIIDSLGIHGLTTILEIGDKYDWGGGLWNKEHASKVVQLAVRLWEDLSGHIGLSKWSLKPLAVASLLHDIGRSKQDIDSNHAKTSMVLIRSSSELAKVLDNEIVNAAACLAKHHRRKPLISPLEDPDCPSNREIEVSAGILKIADGLDYMLNQTVGEIEVKVLEDKITITAICLGNCEDSILKAREKAWLLERALNTRIEITYT